MKDIQLYEQILGLTVPWRVDEVKLKPKEQEIEVRVICRHHLGLSGMSAADGDSRL
jgi:hypothetical protein